MFRQLDVIELHLQQRAVFAGIADQYRAKQGLGFRADHDFFVDRVRAIDIAVGHAARCRAVRITD